MTILRNPAKRLLSLYSYYRQSNVESFDTPAVTLARTLDFHDWLDSGEPDVIVQTSNAIIKQFVPDRFFQDECSANPDNMLASATSFVSEFNMIGFVERMDLVKKEICSALNMPYIETHQHLNKSNSESIKYDNMIR